MADIPSNIMIAHVRVVNCCLNENKKKVVVIGNTPTLYGRTFVVDLAEITAHFAEFCIIYYDTNKNNTT